MALLHDSTITATPLPLRWIIALLAISGVADGYGQDQQTRTYTQTIPGTEVSFEMTFIPSGEFLMGSPESGPEQLPSLAARCGQAFPWTPGVNPARLSALAW